MKQIWFNSSPYVLSRPLSPNTFNLATRFPETQQKSSRDRHYKATTMEKISYFLRVYFVAIFQLYETTCSQLFYHKTFPKQRLFTSLKKPLFQDPSVQELQLLDLLSGGSINSKRWPTLLHWHRSLLNKGGASPLHTKEGSKQHQLCLQIISPLYPSPLRLYYTVFSIQNGGYHV